MAGINRARILQKSESILASAGYQKPCIFLSHISIDQKSAESIGDYIMKKGDIDIYLDANDNALKAAAQRGDAHAVTEFIERGLSNSTHVMCLVSEETAQSWWVPYELGFAKKSKKPLSSLLLIDTVTLPDYLKISTILKGTRSLNIYLERIINKNRHLILESSLMSHASSRHPLDRILDWTE